MLFVVNIEGSHNLGGLFTGGNLVGVNFTLQNRNFARGANQSNTTVGFATELNSGQLAQTTQLSVGQSIYFPRLIPKFWFVPQRWRENARTSLGLNMRYVNRVDYLTLKSVNASWGYEFNLNRTLWSFRYPNIEYTFLDRKQLLDDLITGNQSYK